VIRLDAVELGPAGLGVPLAVEPGPHAVQASAPHRTTWSTSVETKADGTTTAVTIPTLEDAPEATPVVAPPVARVVPVAPSPPPAPSSPWRTAGLVGAGAGVVALGLGTAFGVAAMSQRNEAGCPGNVCPDGGSANTLRAAKSSADVSTALFIAGGALLGGGLAVWWLSAGPAGARTGVLVTPMGVAGTF
jgi:hypothetical protein